MAGLAPKLPITQDSGDGYALLKTMRAAIKQNFKMLILTVPGERVMDPAYGVGMKTYLFGQFDQSTYGDIDLRIREQTKKYMPFVKIQRVSFDAADQDMNRLSVSIKYSIPRIGTTDLLQFTI
jgi:hypothetical protein